MYESTVLREGSVPWALRSPLAVDCLACVEVIRAHALIMRRACCALRLGPVTAHGQPPLHMRYASVSMSAPECPTTSSAPSNRWRSDTSPVGFARLEWGHREHIEERETPCARMT